MSLEAQVIEPTPSTARNIGPSLPLSKRHEGSWPEAVSRIVRGFDSEQLRELLSPGKIDHRLLGPGHFDAHLTSIGAAKLALQIIRYSLPVGLNGGWPRDRLAIIFAFDVPEGTLVHAQPFQSGAIVVLDHATGIEARLSAQSTFAILIVERQLFQSALLDCGAAPEHCGAVAGTALRVHEPEARRLKGLLRAVLDDVDLTTQLLRESAFSVAFERDVLRAFARALVAAEGYGKKGLNVLGRRNRLVKNAESYVAAHLDESIRMTRLCKEVGASPRALEYAFRAVYGTGAMTYLRMVRLNEVRKALLHHPAESTVTVTSAAMDWGFWHLGEFAAAYRRLFGEVPSETLRVASSRQEVTYNRINGAETGRPPPTIVAPPEAALTVEPKVAGAPIWRPAGSTLPNGLE